MRLARHGEDQLVLDIVNGVGEVAHVSGSSEKVIMKNSSCGFAVLKNSTTASFARSILLLMLPLESKITPSETGASSLENVANLLRRIAFEQLEVLFFKPGDQAVHRIGDRHRNQDEIHIHLHRADVGASARQGWEPDLPSGPLSASPLRAAVHGRR